MRKLLVFIFILLSVAIVSVYVYINVDHTNSNIYDDSKAYNEGGSTSSTINTGFNVFAGNRSDPKEIKYISNELTRLGYRGIDSSRLWLRPFGGNSSQSTKSSDWTDKDIKAWVDLQNKYDLKYIFTINFNEKPSDMLDFYNRWIKAGASFQFIELGNEQYSSKFRDSDTDSPEVTDRTNGIDAAKYINMSNGYIRKFSDVGLPYYVQLSTNTGDYSEAWNQTVTKAINNGTFSSKISGITLHMYIQYDKDKDSQAKSISTSVDKVNNLRSMIDYDISVAAVEYGIKSKDSITTSKYGTYNEYINQAKAFTDEILTKLKPGDTVLYNVLYLDSDKNLTPNAFSPIYDGITPLGRTILQTYIDYWRLNK